MTKPAPRRYVALLRAINVGGRTVKMDRLRSIFADLGLTGVETFIASGNVIFDAPRGSVPRLEARIESGLKDALGFDVTTFIRTPAELAAIGARDFSAAPRAAGTFVGFLKDAPAAEAAATLRARSTAIDEFDVDGREVYWICKTSMSLSKFSGNAIEKTLGLPVTMRNITTVRRLAEIS